MIYLLTLTWNNCDKLTKLKDSLLPALYGLDYEWLIKDNASKDNTIEAASTWGNNIKVFPYKDNLQNFSAGMNYLFAEASPKDSDLVILLNNDITINDNKSIKNMIDIINKDSSVGAVGGRLLFTDTNRLQHAGLVIDNNVKLPVHYRAREVTDANAEKNRLFQIVTGAVLVTKAEYFKNIWKKNKSGINGMDENYHWAFDDVDLCLSIKYNMNKKIVYCGNTNIFHEESASLKKNPANRLFMTHNSIYLHDKWFKSYILDKDDYSKNPKHNLY